MCPYAWDRFGGVQSHVRALARALGKRDHDVHVLAPAASADLVGRDHDGASIVGRAVGIPANGSVAPVAFGPLAGAGVRRALKGFAPDVIHVHEPLVPSLSLLALWGASAPLVGTFHAAAETSAGYRIARPVLDRAARRLRVRTAVSAAAAKLAGKYFPGEYLMTPNGVDVARFAGAEPFAWGGERTVLFFGRIEARKGLDVLLRAVVGLKDLAPRLVVAGSGPEEERARARAVELGVEALFLGPVAEEDVARVYRSAAVYCAPGLRGESFGIVLVEAMAAGTPVVCSALEGFRAVVGDGAVLVPADDPGALAAALRLLLTDPSSAADLRSKGTAVAARFDWGRLVPGVEAVYRRAVEGGSG